MKSLLFCFWLLLLSFSGIAQNLNLKHLLKFQHQSQPEINHHLTRKGWTFLSDARPDSSMMGKAVWAFNPVDEGATAWCILYYSDTSPNRILYNIQDGPAMKKIRSKIKKRKMETLAEGDHLERVDYVDSYRDYADGTYVLRLFQYQTPNYEGIKIFRKEDYLKAKANNRL